MARWFGSKATPKALVPGIDDLFTTLRRYVIQETVGSLKAIAISLAIALGGAVLFAIGSVIALVGLLRLLQGETGDAFAGDWSFAPYAITALGGVALVAIGGVATVRAVGPRRGRRG